jgi:hypothetical protein
MAVSLLSSWCCRIGYNPKENSLFLFTGRAGSAAPVTTILKP